MEVKISLPKGNVWRGYKRCLVEIATKKLRIGEDPSSFPLITNTQYYRIKGKEHVGRLGDYPHEIHMEGLSIFEITFSL